MARDVTLTRGSVCLGPVCLGLVCFGLVCFGLVACGPSSEGTPLPTEVKTGSQTNWLKACDDSEECDQLECLCGLCTLRCDAESQCAGLGDASCVSESDPGAALLCGGAAPPGPLCLGTCEGVECGSNEVCAAGVCIPSAPPPETPEADATAPLEPLADARVDIDPAQRFQTLLGFGAGLAYMEDQIVAHPKKAELFEDMFVASGFEVLRIRNRFDDDNAAELAAATEILTSAATLSGRKPTVFMTSGSPPARLKANASRSCCGDDGACTLSRAQAGGFDYDGLAEYWRASLQAHDDAGILPDFVSLQNNPNWVPEAPACVDACRFLPSEGVASMTLGGELMDVAYPGYDEALRAVRGALDTLPSIPRLAAPELNSIDGLADYLTALDPVSYDVLSFHLYETDPLTLEPQQLEALRDLAEGTGHDLVQSEVQVDGVGTAMLGHYSLSSANAVAYLANDFVATGAQDEDSAALIALDGSGYTLLEPYYALAHYARHTEAGWVRVGLVSSSESVLATAWVAPDETALTVVLFNPGQDELSVEIAIAEELMSAFSASGVERTVFGTDERGAELGELADNGVVLLPARGMVTVALSQK